MSYYTLESRTTVVSPMGVRYKIEVWKGYQGFVADVLPMGGNEPIAKLYATTAVKAYSLARRWVEGHR